MSNVEAPPESEQLIAAGDSVQADQSSESESSKQKTVTLTLTIDDIAGDSNQVSLDVREYTVSGQMAVFRKNCIEGRRAVDTDLEPPHKTTRLMGTNVSIKLLARPLSCPDEINNNTLTDSSKVLPLATSSQIKQEESAEANPTDIAAVGESETLPSFQDTFLESGEQQSEETEPQVAETTDTEIGNVTDGSQAVPHSALPQEKPIEPTYILFYERDLPPIGAEEIFPIEESCVGLVQTESVTPMHVVDQKMRELEQEDAQIEENDKNKHKYQKFYWNFILTTYFTTLNDIESSKVDIETVEFHGMLAEIYEFDKSAAWATYEEWTVPTLIKKLLGPMTTSEELNDFQHQLFRALNSLHKLEIYKKSAKKVLAYLHIRLSVSIEPRMLCKLSNEFESDVSEWMLCTYQTNVEMYVVAQEEIRGRLSPNLDYATFPAFVDRLQFYSKCKNKDADSAFLYECYSFFEDHVHIQREVLSDDFQKMFTQPEDSLKDVEMKYFQRVLGLVNKMIVF